MIFLKINVIIYIENEKGDFTMFGYHDASDCGFDLWSPNPTRWGDNAVENRAFSPYAKHQTELDDIVKQIVDTYKKTGQTQISFSVDDDLSPKDLEYIEEQVKKYI